MKLLAMAALVGFISHEVIGGLIAGGLTALERGTLPGINEALGVDNIELGGPTLGGECVSGVSGGVCGVEALGG